MPLDIIRQAHGRPMECGDLFAGVGGWIENDDSADFGFITWLTTEEAAKYVDCGLGAHVHLLDEAR